MDTALPPNVNATDPVACAVEKSLRSLEIDGYGSFHKDLDGCGVGLTFGTTKVRGENYDIALVRMAGALVADGVVSQRFMMRLRKLVPRPDHYFTSAEAA